MLFKCLPPGAQIPGRFPGPVHARGKWFTVDIHCHVLTPKAAEMVAGNADATRHPREVYANERTREVNRQQAERNRIQFTSIENRLADMDRMGIDIQAISPSPNQTYYAADPDLGIATARVVNDNLADIAGRHPDRFVAARARCRFRRPTSPLPSSTGSTNRSVFAASRSRPMSPARISRPSAFARSSPGSKSSAC